MIKIVLNEYFLSLVSRYLLTEMSFLYSVISTWKSLFVEIDSIAIEKVYQILPYNTYYKIILILLHIKINFVSH